MKNKKILLKKLNTQIKNYATTVNKFNVIKGLMSYEHYHQTNQFNDNGLILQLKKIRKQKDNEHKLIKITLIEIQKNSMILNKEKKENKNGK